MELSVNRIYPMASGSTKTLAYVDAEVNGVRIKSCRIVDGKDGPFFSLPQNKGKNGKFYPTVTFKDKNIYGELGKVALAAFAALKKS